MERHFETVMIEQCAPVPHSMQVQQLDISNLKL